MAAKDKTILIRVEPEMKHDLQKLADKSRRSLSNYIRVLLEDAIKVKKTV